MQGNCLKQYAESKHIGQRLLGSQNKGLGVKCCATQFAIWINHEENLEEVFNIQKLRSFALRMSLASKESFPK